MSVSVRDIIVRGFLDLTADCLDALASRPVKLLLTVRRVRLRLRFRSTGLSSVLVELCVRDMCVECERKWRIDCWRRRLPGLAAGSIGLPLRLAQRKGPGETVSSVTPCRAQWVSVALWQLGLLSRFVPVVVAAVEMPRLAQSPLLLGLGGGADEMALRAAAAM